jgi:hypothetical protein
METRRKPLFIVPMFLILHSTGLSLYTLYSGPSRYASHGFGALWPQLIPIFVAVVLAKSVKAKYWGISIIALAVAGVPVALVATIPSYAELLVAATLTLDFISASTLWMAYRYDSFDLSIFGRRKNSHLIMIWIGFTVIMVGIFLYMAEKV